VTAKPSGPVVVAFVLMVAIGGSNAVAVRFSNVELPPFWGAALRFLAAGSIYWILVGARRAPWPSGRALGAALLYGVLAVGVFFGLVYWGLVEVAAGLSMVLLSTSPLFTLFFAAAHGLERFHVRGLLGALTALAGIAIAVGPALGGAVPLTALGAILAASAAVAEGSVIMKLVPRQDPLAVNAIATTSGAAVLLAASRLAGEPWRLPETAATWATFAYLALAGTVVLFSLYLLVLTRWTALGTSYSFLLYPVATVILAAWITAEAVTPRFVAGGVLALAGVWLGAFSGVSSGLNVAAPPRGQP
jgi:drug/metabolite transporter (DMT)-like permease